MQKPIQFFAKNVYGKYLYYIVDQETAWIISNLTGQKTVSPQIIENLKKLGLEF